MKKIRILLLVPFLPVAYAQLQQPPTPAPVTEAQFRPAYTLGPGDQVVVRATNVEEFGDRPYRIESDGSMTLPLVGKIHAAGLTVEQFEADLTTRLKEYVRNPQVSVNVAQYRSEVVFFVGAFKAPGIYSLTGRRTLVEMLATVGGLQTNASRRIKITRRKEMGPIPLPNAVQDPSGETTSVQISMNSLEQNVSPAEDLVLRPFDVVSVETAEVIYVTGDVTRVGAVPLGEHDFITMTQLLSLVGGIAPDGSTKVRVLRPVLDSARRAAIDVDVDKIMKGEANDFPLMPNDVLFVPRAGGKAIWSRAAATGVALAIPLVTSLAVTR
ncbi:MAG TPA: polysaccharide biosynthesis/export family protein [Verrucomicrobiae bacterium]|nr:polysaccharide biosynthesis/export family protein [Bryobacteraceae bacterium]HXU19549.1 polysaccharide biosynthesis/export family protein [Verrucomicrobiae bacterium]